MNRNSSVDLSLELAGSARRQLKWHFLLHERVSSTNCLPKHAEISAELPRLGRSQLQHEEQMKHSYMETRCDIFHQHHTYVGRVLNMRYTPHTNHANILGKKSTYLGLFVGVEISNCLKGAK